MTEVAEAVARFEGIGGTLWLENDRLRYRLRAASSEAGRLLETLRQHKPEVSTLLRERQGQGTVACAHCNGARVCACPACSLRRTADPTPCSMCRFAEHWAWVTETCLRVCWHCGGAGKCRCLVCSMPGKGPDWVAGPCVACDGDRKGGRATPIRQ